MNIYVIGAGAMGSLFAAKLAHAGLAINLVDEWKTQIEAVRSNGIHGQIGENSITAKPPVYLPHEAQEPADLMILFVKSMQLEHYLQEVRHLIKPNTAVICLLNGLGHEMILEKYLPRENIFLGITIWAAGLDRPGVFHSSPTGNIELQNLVDSAEAKHKAHDLVDLLNRGDLNAVYSENVKFSIWRKACVNGTSNTLCTLLETNVAGLNNSKHHQKILRPIVEEFVTAAKLSGVDLDAANILQYLDKVFHNPALMHHYPSMYQDLIKNHRPTEIDYLNGAVAKILQAHGMAAPVCQLLTDLIHAKEDLLIIK